MSRDEKERRVIDLYNQGKTYRQIAEEVRISPNDIHAILKKEEKNNSIVTNNKKQTSSSIAAKAYDLFSKGKKPIEVAITLNLPASKVSKLYREYWDLKGLGQLNTIHKETNGNTWPLWKLYQQLVMKNGMSIEQVVNGAEIGIHKLPHMETLYKQVEYEVNKLQYARQSLVNDIRTLERKISVLDKTAFSIEQDCKRTEQRVQELADKKDRLEKLIANILNGEGYSKLKQIVNENVKASLSENKQVISVSFAALIQSLKADPEMVNSIYTISLTNANNRRYNDNDDNDNAIKYFESNKDNLLDLAEKNYENLIELLTNNVMNTAAASSLSNSSLSPKFNFGTWNQSDTYKIEESESHNNSKGGISD